MSKIIYFTEHSEPYEDKSDKDVLQNIQELANHIKEDNRFIQEDNIEKPKYLGLYKQFDSIKADYYIGAAWLNKDIVAVVEPKIEKVDYMSLFASAFCIDTNHEAQYFSQYFGINYDQPMIEIESDIASYITPLLVTYYISLLNMIAKRGLKKDYIYKEENLTSKVKGRIKIQKNFRLNQIMNREDRVYCGFNEYTTDIPENRLLKKSLLFAENAIKKWENHLHNQSIVLFDKINVVKSAFEGISDDIDVRTVQNIKSNKLFIGYKEAVRVAKMILRQYDYSMSNTENNAKIYPFWIDMPRLYEMYVYSQLKAQYGDELLFQVDGSYKTQADYILKKQKLILDAKYKPRYENSQSGIITDIREISGYARDEKILKNFDLTDNPNEEINCIIIYPPQSDFEECVNKENAVLSDSGANDNKLKQRKVNHFRNFYFYKLPLPMMK